MSTLAAARLFVDLLRDASSWKPDISSMQRTIQLAKQSWEPKDSASRLSDAHKEIPMETIFKDWQVINDYFVEELGTDEAAMLSLRNSTFIVPAVNTRTQIPLLTT